MAEEGKETGLTCGERDALCALVKHGGSATDGTLTTLGVSRQTLGSLRFQSYAEACERFGSAAHVITDLGRLAISAAQHPLQAQDGKEKL